MFNLIAAVLSIALMGVLAVASIFYAGNVIETQTVRSEANVIVNQSAQVKGALDLHMVLHGTYPGGDATAVVGSLLSAQLLRDVPGNPEYWTFSGSMMKRSVPNEMVCIELNARHGHAGCPPCDGAPPETAPACLMTES